MINIESIHTKCRLLRLPSLFKAVENQEKLQEAGTLSFLERLDLALDYEINERANKRILRNIKSGNFKYFPEISSIIYDSSRNLSKDVVSNLLTGSYIQNHKNVVISGATGTGKTYLGCILGIAACRGDYTVKYVRLPSLLIDLALSKESHDYRKTMNALKRVNLLIIDDFGMSQMNIEETKDFLEIIEDRFEVNSVMIMSQLPVSDWYQVFGDQTYADAIMDRLISSSTRIELKGDSLRNK